MTPQSGGERVRARRGLTAVGLLLWAAAVAVALRAQQYLAPAEPPESGWIWYGVAAVLALVAFAFIERQAPLPAPSPPDVELLPWDRRSRRWVLAAALVGVAVVSSGVVVWLLQIRHGYQATVWLWLLALSTLLVAALITGRQRVRTAVAPFDSRRLFRIAVVGAIILLTVALRVPKLAQIPPEVHGDEAACGLEARRILSGEVTNIFHVGWYHIPYLSFGISALFMRIFGDNLYGFRMASVFQGTVSVLLMYLITKRLFGVRVALLTAFLLAVSHWHIHFSRSGINYLQALFAALVLFHFLLRGFDTRRPADFILAGYGAGLCIVVYYAARLAPVLAAGYVLHRAISEPGFLRRQWSGLATAALGAVVFLAPMSVVYAHNPEVFVSRTQGVLVFSPENERHALYSYQVPSMLDVLEIQAVNSLKAFNSRGETSLQHGHRAPLIDFWTSALFVLGVAVVTPRLRQTRYFFVTIWFWLTLLLGSVLTVDSLFSPRVIGIVPVLFVFPALILDGGWRATSTMLGRVGTYVFGVLVAVFLVLAARANYADYFDLHIHRLQPASFNTELSHFVLEVNDRYRVYLIGRPDTSLRYDTEHFLLPDVDGVEVRDQPLPLPLNRVPADKGVAFLIEDSAGDVPERLAALKQAYPNGKLQHHIATNGAPLFDSYLVEHDALVAAKPDAEIDHERIPALLLSQLPPAAPHPPAAVHLPHAP